MNKAFCIFLLLAASAFVACDVPPPPDDDNDAAAGEDAGAIVSTVQARSQSETIATTQGVIIRFEDGSFEARMPPDFGEPGFESIPQPRLVINRHIARNGNRLVMVGWNDHEEGFFETVVIDSFLNVAKYTTLRQMEGELLQEERISHQGYPGIQFTIRYEDMDREAPTPEPVITNNRRNRAPEPEEPPREMIPIYSRYKYIVAPPQLFQMTYSTPDETELESATINAFFDSFQLDIEPYDPEKYE